EAVEEFGQADLILIGPGSFFTSLLPVLLLPEIAQALRRSPASMVFIGNLGKELSPAAAGMTTVKNLEMMESVIGNQVIDALLLG
ncbi:2-phospho-L-lactate transferase CofD family protein, partial [Erwinia amylovora]|uniref:2-phospho-L-lactate transferase CofD family protein n=1 Tax=Erwinia amylovora TaxID=552 RepID=UPI0020BF6555